MTLQRYSLCMDPHCEHPDVEPDTIGSLVLADDALTEIRRLRAMVLKGHSQGMTVAWYLLNELGLPQTQHKAHRRARLLNHWASAVEAGRL